MKFHKTILIASLLSLTTLLFALTATATSLHQDRLKTINQYLTALKNRDARTMYSLFIPNGKVVSTSKGKTQPGQFFTAFFSELKSASVETINIYKDVADNNHYAARFKFKWIEKNGASGGNYMDEFTFQQNSNKIVQVYMFENKY